MRILATTLCSLGVFFSAFAGQATGTYLDAAGTPRVTVTITVPNGEAGIEYFEALKLAIKRTDGPAREPLVVDEATRAALPLRGRAGIRTAPGLDGSPAVDWSGVRTEFVINQVSTCEILQAEVDGFIFKHESVFFDSSGTMAHVSVLSTVKGDADLFVYDDTGTEVCASAQPKFTKIADQCYYLSADCGTGAFPESTIEVYGFKKRNFFNLSIWFVDAL